jgi:hypothetical protein
MLELFANMGKTKLERNLEQINSDEALRAEYENTMVIYADIHDGNLPSPREHQHITSWLLLKRTIPYKLVVHHWGKLLLIYFVVYLIGSYYYDMRQKELIREVEEQQTIQVSHD